MNRIIGKWFLIKCYYQDDGKMKPLCVKVEKKINQLICSMKAYQCYIPYLERYINLTTQELYPIPFIRVKGIISKICGDMSNIGSI